MDEQLLIETVKAHGQDHVFRYLNELDETGKAGLFEQLGEINWDRIDDWIANYVLKTTTTNIPTDLCPAPFFPLQPDGDAQRERYVAAEERGCELLAAGKVAAFTVAGGQGTRLDFDHPKGMYPIAPISGKSLFQWFAEGLQRNEEIYQTTIPWYIMTSKENYESTVTFFEEMEYFGMSPENVTFFAQGQMPVFNAKGRLLLRDKGEIFMSPNGHGGSLQALNDSGALEDMTKRGVEIISYFQVDNPLVSTVDPLFIGLHSLEGAQMSARIVPKRSADEKLGVFCQAVGKTRIIEYSDLPGELAGALDEQGELRFISGSPAIHLIDRTFVEELNRDGFALPFHRAEKKVPYYGRHRKPVKAKRPNGVKLETFVFDALPMAGKTMLLECAREDEFAPVKNKEGTDSAVSCRRIMQEMFAAWLTARGVSLPRTPDGQLDCKLEISPRSYVTQSDFERAPLPESVTPGQELHIQ